jgi:IclR family pca regulon transcriptional regulator
MARREASPDFTGALARGLDVIRAFQPRQPVRSLTAPATAGGLARPAARRVLPLNVTVHAAQTPVQTVTGEYLPLPLQTAGAISADWARYQSAPHVTAPPGALTASTAASRLQVSGQVSGQRTAR